MSRIAPEYMAQGHLAGELAVCAGNCRKRFSPPPGGCPRRVPRPRRKKAA